MYEIQPLFFRKKAASLGKKQLFVFDSTEHLS